MADSEENPAQIDNNKCINCGACSYAWRGKSPIQRARCIIDNCVHPDYKPLLEEYLAMGIKGHTPQNLKCCFAFHEELAASGDMHNVDWSKYNK